MFAVKTCIQNCASTLTSPFTIAIIVTIAIIRWCMSSGSLLPSLDQYVSELSSTNVELLMQMRTPFFFLAQIQWIHAANAAKRKKNTERDSSANCHLFENLNDMSLSFFWTDSKLMRGQLFDRNFYLTHFWRHLIKCEIPFFNPNLKWIFFHEQNRIFFFFQR